MGLFCLLYHFQRVVAKPNKKPLQLAFHETPTFIFLCVSQSVMSNSLQPMNYSPPGSSVYGFLQARILEWVAIPFSRGSSWPRDQNGVSCIADRFLTICTTREALHILMASLKKTEDTELKMEGKSFLEIFKEILKGVHVHDPKGLPSGSVVRIHLKCTGDARDVGLVPGLGRSPAVGNSNPLQYSCLGNLMDRGAWKEIVHSISHRVTKDLVTTEHV